MPSLQFHATTPEIVAMAAARADEFSLSAALGTPAGPQLVENGDFSAVPEPDYVLLGRRRLQLPAGAALAQLIGLNPGSMVLRPGGLTPAGLSESSLSGDESDPESRKLWQRLVNRARRSLHAGAVVSDPSRNALGRYPSHRYTDGALLLQAGGTRMRNIAGTGSYRLTPDPVARALPDRDVIALATVSHTVDEWVTNELIPPDLVEQLRERLARYRLVDRGASAGEVTVLLQDLVRRLHHAFADDDPPPPARAETIYTVRLPDDDLAQAVAATLPGATATGRDVQVTLAGVAPDAAHLANERRLIDLVHDLGGEYAGWFRPGTDE